MSDAAAAAVPAPSGSSKGLLILALVNTLVVLSGLGAMTYTRLMYKRPVITEKAEIKRIEQLKTHKTLAPAAAPTPGLVNFDPMTVNIQALPSATGKTPRMDGKLHYVTVGFSLELRDARQKELIDTLRPVVLDEALNLIGRKAFTELTTVQGRYVLRAQIRDTLNRIATKEAKSTDPVVMNVYFTQFIVQ